MPPCYSIVSHPVVPASLLCEVGGIPIAEIQRFFWGAANVRNPMNSLFSTSSVKGKNGAAFGCSPTKDMILKEHDKMAEA